MKYGKLCIDNRLSCDPKNLAAGGKEVTVGVDDPNQIKYEVVERLLRKVPGYRYVAAHVPYSKEMDSLIGGLGYKGIVVTRDPRDVVASHVPFIMKTKSHYLHQFYESLKDDDIRLMVSIQGGVGRYRGCTSRAH